MIELEKKITYQEDTIESLHQTILEAHHLISRLEARIKMLEDKVNAGPVVKKIEDETPPPHY
ncbi:MAG: SlyX family protein [Candidatus Omnitrophica bacterium]|nr:SlyX family protein [Candidatus Omnitrophota bacterium]